MTSLKAYVISHESSKVVSACVESLKKFGWPFEKFPAIDGRKIGDKDWEDIGVKMSPTAGKLPKRKGAQGCWFSHWKLWEKCALEKTAIIILEHDAVIVSTWPDDIDIDTCIVKLYQTAPCKTKENLGTWSKGAHAYTVTPKQAKNLMDRARTFGASPVDKHIISNAIPWRFFDRDLVKLNQRREASTTSGHI
jgi:glycosyl transferase family 25